MLINRKFGDYVLLRRLAVGGQSEVFLALKQGPGDFRRTVVIKALPSSVRHDDTFVKLFFKEAFIASKFTHPNAISIHDAKRIEDDYCLIMDFVSGQTVSDIAQRGFKGGDPLKLSHAVQIIADACDGLHYAHTFRDLDGAAYSFVHCDISPQNLMVTYQGVTKVFDFGIAQVIEEGTDQAELPVGGKYAYMSPEQIEGKPLDHRSDIFSLGIILYELAAGYRLFRRNTQQEVIKAVCEEPIRPPSELRPDLPRFLDRCILKALERDPSQRYMTAAAMRDDLLQFLAMAAKGGERDELGRYVASLFEEERAEIAETIRQGKANDVEPKPLGDMTLGDIAGGFGDDAENTMELEAPQVVRELRAMERAESEREAARETRARQDAEAIEARRRAAALSVELKQAQRRQSMLWGLVATLLVLLLALGAWGMTRPTAQPAQPLPAPSTSG